MTSFIYRHPKIYQATMRRLYGKDYEDRYARIANLIPTGASVTELCMGDGYLYQHYLSKRDVSYTGMEYNGDFIKHAQKMGANCIKRNVLTAEIPAADVVLMHASLYQFIPDERKLIDRMFNAANRMVILAEPIKNLSNSENLFVRAVARRAANPGTGNAPDRFTEQTFGQLLNELGTHETYFSAGGREMIGVFYV